MQNLAWHILILVSRMAHAFQKVVGGIKIREEPTVRCGMRAVEGGMGSSDHDSIIVNLGEGSGDESLRDAQQIANMATLDQRRSD